MQRWSLAALVTLVSTGCPSKPGPVPPKKPNDELIVGEFERRPPTGEQAVRFASDGNFVFAKKKAELERTPHLSEGTYKLDGTKLTFSTVRGECEGATKEGSYEIVISKVGIRFVKIDDGCESRSKLDGQTWWRIK